MPMDPIIEHSDSERSGGLVFLPCLSLALIWIWISLNLLRSDANANMRWIVTTRAAFEVQLGCDLHLLECIHMEDKPRMKRLGLHCLAAGSRAMRLVIMMHHGLVRMKS